MHSDLNYLVGRELSLGKIAVLGASILATGLGAYLPGIVRAEAPKTVSTRLVVEANDTVEDPLARPIAFPSEQAGSKTVPTDGNGSFESRATSTFVGGLAVCIGSFLLFVWATRRTAPRGNSLLPDEVVELLGRKPVAARQQLQLIRLGHKLVLVSVSPTGIAPLTEVTDPAEVERLAGMCQQAKPNSATSAFRDVLGEFAQEPTRAGFVPERESDIEAAKKRVPLRRTRRENDDVSV